MVEIVRGGVREAREPRHRGGWVAKLTVFCSFRLGLLGQTRQPEVKARG